MGILLGDAVPQNLVGTNDTMFYNHYSEISTVEANWDLDTLGRWDVGANVFDVVAQKTGDHNSRWQDATGSKATHFFNQSFAGPFSSVNSSVPYPVPNTQLSRSSRHVLPQVSEIWGAKALQKSTYYTNTVKIPDGLNPPAGWAL